MIVSRVQEALSEVIAGGYQILPNAFELLLSLDGEYDIVRLIHMIMQTKKIVGHNKFEITEQDIRSLLPQPIVMEKNSEGGMVECDLKINSDVDVQTI